MIGWVGNSTSLIIIIGIQIRRISIVRANKTLSVLFASMAILISTRVTRLLARKVALCLLIARNAMMEIINSAMYNTNVITVLNIFTVWFSRLKGLVQGGDRFGEK